MVDLDVRLEPAPMRTIAGELGYGTGEGVRVEGSWQHRNFFNPEGALTVRGVAGTQEQLASVSLRRSNFRQRDQVLTGLISASNVDRKAYAARTFQLSGGIERQSNFIWQKKWTWSLGGELIASDERDTIEATGEDRRRTFFVAAIPASLGYDGSDDLLDPTDGFRLGGRVSPELSFQGGTFPYARAQIDASAYRRVSDRVVAAGRIRLGTIVGAGRDDIAPSRRFYAGGGGSVRGYGYQQLGPRDVDGDPIGGRSLAEFSLEARVRLKAFGGNFGDRAVPRRRIADQFVAARTCATGSSAPGSAFAIIPASARSGSTSAPRSTRARAMAGWRSRCRSARRSSDGRRDQRAGARDDEHWSRRLLNEVLALLLALLLLFGAGLVLLDSAPGHRWLVDRIAQHRDRDRAEDPDRADRRLDLRHVAAQERARVGQQGRVPDLARHHCSTGRPGRGSATGCTSTGSRRDG